jgi:hypothetical protein
MVIDSDNKVIRLLGSLTAWEHHVPLAYHSGHEADHSSLSSVEVKEWVELYLHSPNVPTWRGDQLGGAMGQLYLYLYLLGSHNNKYKTMAMEISWFLTAE